MSLPNSFLEKIGHKHKALANHDKFAKADAKKMYSKQPKAKAIKKFKK